MAVSPEVQIRSVADGFLKQIPACLNRTTDGYFFGDFDGGEGYDADALVTVRDRNYWHPEGSCAFGEDCVERGHAHLKGWIAER